MTVSPRIRDYAWPLVVCAALVAVIWTATAIALSQLRASVENEAAAMRQNLANSLAEREASSVRAIDISLMALREAWTRHAKTFDEAVRQHEQLLQRERVIQAAVLDADGWLVYSRLPVGERLNFSDRAYFKEHRAQPERDTLVISAPVMGRVTREWAIQFTRPILADGRFAGLIVVAVPPPALETVYREIDLGPKGVITLARRDGQILARSTDLPGSVSVSVAPVNSTGASGHFFSRGPVDGIPRYMSYREVEDYGLVIFVGQSVEAVLAPYVRGRAYLVAASSAATVLLVCVGVLFSLRRRDKARFRAERERMMLELHDGCIQSIYAVGLALQGSRALVRDEPDRANAAIARAEADLNLVIQELRAFMGAEKVAPLTPERLRAEIERALPQTATRFDVQLDPDALDGLAAEEAAHVLRIIREAAANVARHSNASRASIRLAREAGEVRLDIADDGDGIVAGDSHTGLGLAHIEARARKLRGTARIAGVETGGTRVSVRFPLRP